MKKTLVILLAFLSLHSLCLAQWDKDVFSLRGTMALQEGKYADAIQHFNVLERLDSTDYWNYFYRGIAKYNLGDIRGALTDFNSSVRLNPIFTNGYHFRAITESRIGQYDQALADLEKAIELRPGNIGVYYSRGVTNFLAQKFDDALRDFDYYISKERTDASAYLNRGATKLFLKDTVSALNDYNKAIKLNSKDPEGYIRRGRIFASRSEFDKAVKDMDSALERDPENTMAYFTRAIMYHELLNYNAAMADFNKVLELEPGNALTLYNRALLRARVGDYEAAVNDLDRVIRINPDNVLAHYNRAAVHMELGRYQDAVEDYSEAIALYPDFANAYMGRSLAELRLGRNKASKSDYYTAKRKISEYHQNNQKNPGSYADTTKKYNALLQLDGEFAKKDFNDELLQNRDIDVKLRPLFKFILGEEQDSNTLDREYENLLVEHFQDTSPLPLTISNGQDDPDFEIGHNLNYILAGDSASGAGKATLSASETYFLKGLNNLRNKQFNQALENFNLAIQQSSDKNEKDRYSRFYKAFYLLNRAVLRAEMLEFIANIQNNVTTLNMDDKGVARTKVKDQITNDFDYSEAIDDLQEAISILPELPFLHYDIANLFCLSGKPVESIESYSKAISLYPEMGDAYFNRGLVQILVQDKEKGCMDFSKAGELGVKDAYGMITKYCRSDE